MTVITYTTHYHKPYSKRRVCVGQWSQFHHSSRIRNRSLKKQALNFSSQILGRINIFWLLGLAIIIMLISWTVLRTQVVAIDYAISNLKYEIKQAEEQNTILKEQLANLVSNQQIEEWAQKNGFVKLDINKVSYLDIEENNLAHVNVTAR